jgi:hypothetical protein
MVRNVLKNAVLSVMISVKRSVPTNARMENAAKLIVPNQEMQKRIVVRKKSNLKEG